MVKPPVEARVQSIARATCRAIRPTWAERDRDRAYELLSQHRKQLRRVSRAKSKGWGKLKYEIRFTLESYPAQFCAAARVLDEQYRKYRKTRLGTEAKNSVPPPSFAQIKDLAERVSPYVLSTEPYRTFPKPKTSGGERILFEFGSYRKSQQTLVADPLSILVAGQEPRDYALLGGTKSAIEEIVSFEAKQPNGGGHAYITADVEAYFDSIAPRGLEALLPLPIWVTRNIVCNPESVCLGRKRALYKHSQRSGTLQEGSLDGRPAGLPTGSAASNVVGAYILQTALAPLLKRVKIAILYRDDIVLAVDGGLEGAKALARELQDILENHPAGPLKVKWSSHNSKDGFEFLGYFLSKVSKVNGGTFRARASYDARDRFRARLIRTMLSQPTADDSFMAGTKYLERWIGGFSAWHVKAREIEFHKWMVLNLWLLLVECWQKVGQGIHLLDPNQIQWSKGPCGGTWTVDRSD